MTNLKANMIEAGAPILKEGNQIGALVIRKNLEPQNKDLINILIKPFIIGSFIMRDISSDMHYVVYETKRIAKGNLGKKLSNPTFSDRTLMNSISEMIYGLQKKLVDINESTSKVETATKEIIEKVTNQRDYSTKFGNSVQEVNEISEVFWETIHRFEDDVKQVSNQSEAAVQRIVALGTKAQQIGTVTTAINDIAKRINLLSLNASIEAAQAGEHGQGFAVVAAEIRKLAESTKRSIEDIGELIEDIQSATNTTLLSTEQTVDSVKKIIDAVHNQVVLGKKVKAAIRQISDEIQEGIDITDNLETNSQQLQEATQSMRSGLEKFELY